ncbi:MAG: histidinol-phosphatase HisJ family protein [Erysipelotrichaceae bacterium]|nr:histidinol-phosphatase HisJ family protein [Erysipelotrichaceae bacterium]
MKMDYHLHTEFSDDSQEPMENQVKRAIELGFEEICFTDHVDYGVKNDWADGNIQYRAGDGIGKPEGSLDPIANVDYPLYFEKLHLMKKQYGDRIRIKQGLEFGMQTITIDKYEKLFARYKDELDFVLLSIHEIDNKELWTMDYQRERSWKEYNEGYYNELYQVMKKYKDYSILSHLDLIVRYDPRGRYPFEKVEDQIAEILKLAIIDGKGIEINTSSWHYGLDDTMPSRQLLKLHRDLGGKIITIGSDGHTTRYVGDHFEDAVDILKDIGFTHVAGFTKMKPELHEI